MGQWAPIPASMCRSKPTLAQARPDAPSTYLLRCPTVPRQVPGGRFPRSFTVALKNPPFYTHGGCGSACAQLCP